ncbi:MAG: hypothetical protein KBD47_01355 [Candidatus Pacebacteria bacterium]|nr:hypothetical protein [Candidatus Paceibacterota bacterium]
MKKFILTALCALSTAFLAEGMDFKKLDIGSEAALLHNAITNGNGLVINGTQPADNENGENWLWVFAKRGERYKTFDAFSNKLKGYLTNVVAGAKTHTLYDPMLPVEVNFSLTHQEVYVDFEGEIQVYFVPVLYGVGSENDLAGIKLQFPRTGFPLKFATNVVRARLEVLDRNRYNPNFSGPLFYRYVDTDVSPTDDRIYLGSGTDGDVRIQEQYLINGGPNGPWDVFFEFTFVDGAVRRYNGNGDLIETTYQLFIRRDGKLDIMGGRPGQQLIIESTTDLNGTWFPESEKAVVRQNAPTTIPVYEPPRFYRVQQNQ